jgi:transcriptional regulator with XRE-family HTH domain/tetratricopeptide (TPR) repeat protein
MDQLVIGREICFYDKIWDARISCAVPTNITFFPIKGNKMDSILCSSFGDMLKALRKRKCLTQQELAFRVGVHRNTIGTWEQGHFLPESKTIVLELAHQLHLTAQETHHLLEASLTGLTPYWSVPYPRNPFFTGRHALLENLHERLHPAQSVAFSQTYGLSGLGGIGKTQLALEYAYHHAHDYHAVFWITAETHATIHSSMALIAYTLQSSSRHEEEPQKVVTVVQRWLTTHKGWLLIFDNVEEAALLKAFLPSARQGAILLTTRLRALDGLASLIDVPLLSAEEGRSLLLARSQCTESVTAPLSPQQLAQATSIVEMMDRLPLALDQAGAYIEHTRCSLNDYLHLFERHRRQLLDERPVLTDHPHSVYQTFLLAFTHIREHNPAAADLMCACAFLAPDTIPEALFLQAGPSLGSYLHAMTTNLYQFNQLLAETLRFSLLTRHAHTHTFSMHRLVQATIKEAIPPDIQRLWRERIFDALDNIFPEDGALVEHWSWCEQLLPHIAALLQGGEDDENPFAQASLFHKTACYLHHQARYQEAERYDQHALHLYEHMFGSHHPSTIDALIGVAEAARFQGKREKAVHLFLQALAQLEQSVGENHFRCIAPLNGLASIYREQEHLIQAENTVLRALTIWQHTRIQNIDAPLPISHTHSTTHHQGSQELIEEVLSLWKQDPQDLHYEVGYALFVLAAIYHQQHRNSDAEAIAICGREVGQYPLGQHHPFLIKWDVLLADIAKERCQFSQAEKLYLQAHTRGKETLKKEHPQYTHLREGLIDLYRRQGKLPEYPTR